MSNPYYPQNPQSYGPPAYAGAPIPGQMDVPVLQFGDVTVTQTEVITPAGRVPLRGSQFLFSDSSMTTQSTPAWAIVLAVIGFFFFFLGLLFLLVKEERTTGFVTITVTTQGFTHTAHVPVMSRAQVMALASQTNHANAMARY